MAQSSELIIRTRRKVSITEAGLARAEDLAAEGNDQRTIAKELGLPWSTFRDLRDRDEALQEALERGLGALGSELTHHLLAAEDAHVPLVALLEIELELFQRDRLAVDASQHESLGRSGGRGGDESRE